MYIPLVEHEISFKICLEDFEEKAKSISSNFSSNQVILAD